MPPPVPQGPPLAPAGKRIAFVIDATPPRWPATAVPPPTTRNKWSTPSSPIQQFTRRHPARHRRLPCSSGHLVAPTIDNKTKARTFLNGVMPSPMSPKAGARAEPALRIAFASGADENRPDQRRRR